jgi:restriction endonuclease Mrr
MDGSVPTVRDLEPLVVNVLQAAGGEARIGEIHDALASSGALTADQLSVTHGAGKSSEVQYRTRWALVKLRQAGAVEHVGRGEWRLTRAPGNA